MHSLKKPRILVSGCYLLAIMITTGCVPSVRTMNEGELWLRAEDHSRASEHADSLAYLDELLRRNGEDYRALVLRGVAHSELDETTPALSDLMMAIEIAPSRAPARLQRASLAIKSGNFVTAEVDLAALLEISTSLDTHDQMALHVLVGTLRFRQERAADALRSYEKAIDLGQQPGMWTIKHYQDALYNAAQVHFEARQDFAAAWKHYSQYVEVRQKQGLGLVSEDHYVLGMLAYLRGDFSLAQEHLAEAPGEQTNRLLEEFDDRGFFKRAYR